MTTPTLPTVTPCALCPRETFVGLLCRQCFHHLDDLLSDRPGSTWNPRRPDDPYSPPGCRWLLQHVGDGQRATRPELGGRAGGGFRSTSPADDTVLALHDRRTQPDDSMPWLAGRRWLYRWTAEALAQHVEVATARTELRALHRALLRLVHDEHGPRLVGHCRTLVTAHGVPLGPDGLAASWALKPAELDYPEGIYTCSAPLWSRPTRPAGDDETPPLPSVRCPACRTVYGGLSLARMGRIDVEDVAA